MNYLPTGAVYLVLALGWIAVLAGVLCAGIYRKIDTHSETSLAKLKLRPGKTRNEFRALYVANWFIFLMLLVYTAGSVFRHELVMNGARAGFVVFAVAVAGVVLRWYRRL